MQCAVGLELDFAGSRPATMLDAIGDCFLDLKDLLAASHDVSGVILFIFAASNPLVPRRIVFDSAKCTLSASLASHIGSIFF